MRCLPGWLEGICYDMLVCEARSLEPVLPAHPHEDTVHLRTDAMHRREQSSETEGGKPGPADIYEPASS